MCNRHAVGLNAIVSKARDNSENCDKNKEEGGSKLKAKLQGLGFANEVAMLMTMHKQKKTDAAAAAAAPS